jgi:hypothetical protein
LLTGFKLLDSWAASLEVDGADISLASQVVVIVFFVGHGAGEEEMVMILVLAALQQSQLLDRVSEFCLEYSGLITGHGAKVFGRKLSVLTPR